MPIYPPSTFLDSAAPLRRPDFWASVADIVWNLFHITPLAIFVFITCVPSQALAYAQEIKVSQSPLVFIRDPQLVDSAIMGIDAFSSATTAGQLIHSRASTIRSVNISQIYEGAAIRVLAFAYSSSINQTDADPFTTASGQRVQAGTMAANWLPFGTKVRIGSTMYTIGDRMNERYNSKYIVDVWQPTHADAISWGARVVEMEIVSLP